MPVLITNVVGMGAPAFCEYICPVGTLEGGIPLAIFMVILSALFMNMMKEYKENLTK